MEKEGKNERYSYSSYFGFDLESTWDVVIELPELRAKIVEIQNEMK